MGETGTSQLLTIFPHCFKNKDVAFFFSLKSNWFKSLLCKLIHLPTHSSFVNAQERIIWLVPSTVLQLTDAIVSEQKQL